jgi:hypothetical protein
MAMTQPWWHQKSTARAVRQSAMSDLSRTRAKKEAGVSTGLFF